MVAVDEASSSAFGARFDRRSPPTTSQSKRDRKRQQLCDRLSSMSETLQRERDVTYRDQLQRIQYEVLMVQQFDPYWFDPLDMIDRLDEEYSRTQPPPHADNARSLLEMAGLQFSDFASEVEDLIEVRDFQLAQSKNEFERKVQENKNTHAYKIETAKREHRSLTSTLRDRLINTLTSKKNRLNREKEVLEINDSNALLLNPNQFSLTNPASPGGAHVKRATRLRKDADDLSMFPDGKKRKRNGGDDDGSPGPLRRALDPNNTTLLWQSEKARAAAKRNGQVYSLDNLFTDKELSLHYNSAALAAHQYILRNRVNGQASSPDDSDVGNGDTDEHDNESVPSAAAMERQVSHATRSTRGGTASQNFLDDKVLGIEGIANLEIPGNLDIMHSQEPPKMPPFVPQQYLKPIPRHADQNFPVALSQEDVQSDLAVMSYFKQYDDNKKQGAHLDVPTGMRKVLEAVATPYHQGRFLAFTRAPRDDHENVRDALGLPATSGLRDQPSPGHAGPVPSVAAFSNAAGSMSRQSSVGGVAMSRQGTGGSARGKSRRN